MIYEINLLTIVVMMCLSGLTALLANRNIAVFHDGLRPMYGQYLNKAIDRKTLFATSLSLSFGLVVGFGIPTSIAGGLLIVHAVFLGTDIIGTMFKDDKKGAILATISGAIFGVTLMFFMESVIKLIEMMPINFLGDLSQVGGLIITAFIVFPALAIAYQVGAKKGILSLILIILLKQATGVYGNFTMDFLGEPTTINIDENGIALITGMFMMVFFAAISNKKSETSSEEVFKVFSNNIVLIRKNILILALSGGLVALATNLLIIAEGPASLTVTADIFRSGGTNYNAAAIISFSRFLGFVPLVMTTAILSGVYSPCGTKAVHLPAILFINMGIMGMAGSFLIGGLIMALEVVLLGFIARGMDKFPGMKDLGDHSRTAMSKTLELALLVGGMLSANAIAPSFGYIWVIGLFFLNQTSKKPVSPMAIGPIGAISIGIIVNILYLLNLFPVS